MPTKHHKKPSDQGLSLTERLIIWVGLFINPIVTFIITILLWKTSDPQKWKDSVGIFKLYLAIIVGLAFLAIVSVFLLTAMNPKGQIEKARQMKQEATSSYELNVETK